MWILLYFCSGAYHHPPYAGGANICIAFSLDQREWVKSSTPLYAHGGHPKGYDAEHAHKVWLTTNPATGVQCEWGGRGPAAAGLRGAAPRPLPAPQPLLLTPRNPPPYTSRSLYYTGVFGGGRGILLLTSEPL